jgi:hypothetical protein
MGMMIGANRNALRCSWWEINPLRHGPVKESTIIVMNPVRLGETLQELRWRD